MVGGAGVSSSSSLAAGFSSGSDSLDSVASSDLDSTFF